MAAVVRPGGAAVVRGGEDGTIECVVSMRTAGASWKVPEVRFCSVGVCFGGGCRAGVAQGARWGRCAGAMGLRKRAAGNAGRVYI